MDPNELTDEQKEQARECGTEEELDDIAEEELDGIAGGLSQDGVGVEDIEDVELIRKF